MLMRADWVPTERPFVLGAPMFVDFVWENVSQRALTFPLGSSRETSPRFATSGASVLLLDPYVELDGLEEIVSAPPGMREQRRLHLLRYLRFTQPGTYTIEGAFDFRLSEQDVQVEVESFTRSFAIRVERDAARVAKALSELEARCRATASVGQLDAIVVAGELGTEASLDILAGCLGRADEAAVEAAIVACGRSPLPRASGLLEQFAATSASAPLVALAEQWLRQRADASE